VRAGSGDDKVQSDGYSWLDGGDGDDYLTAGANSVLIGAAGDDRLSVGDESRLDGGEGNDLLYTRRNSIVNGGQGDDAIQVGDGSVVLFNKGDGHDVLQPMGKTSISSGLLGKSEIVFGPDVTPADLSIATEGDRLVINIGGGDDSITLQTERNLRANITPAYQGAAPRGNEIFVGNLAWQDTKGVVTADGINPDQIPTMRFADGTVMTAADIVNLPRSGVTD